MTFHDSDVGFVEAPTPDGCEAGSKRAAAGEAIVCSRMLLLRWVGIL